MIVENEEKKAEKEWRDHPVWILFLSLAVLAGTDAINLLYMGNISEKQAYFYTFMQYMSFWPIWAIVLVLVFFVKKNREIKDVITTKAKGNRLSYLLWGLLAGVVMNGVCAVTAILHGDFKLEFVKFEFLPFLGLFIAVFVQSSAEEVLCRAVVYQRLLKGSFKYGHVVPIIGNSLFFSLIHAFNDGITYLALYDIFITGVLFSLMVYYFDSLWMAMGAHATWNFTQSIFLGLPNSGASFPYSVFRLGSEVVHQSFAYDVGFGLEGTILSATLMTVCCIAPVVWKKNKSLALEKKVC